MANYYQNNDGTTSVKKKGTGKNFIQQENGSTTEVTFDNNVKKVKNKSATAPLAIIPKTILSTANYLGQGTLKGLEGIADAIIDVGTSNINPYYWFNQDKLKEHNKIAKEIIETDATNELITKLSGDENFNQNVLDKNSVIKSTNIGGQVAQGIGQMLPAISLGNPVAATGTIGISSYGSGVEEAYNDGANTSQAKLYGLGNMATELATEWITGGIPGVKNKLFSGLDNLVAKGLGKETLEEVSKSITKELLQVGYKMVGEGAEEGLTEILKPMLKNAIYTEGEKVNWDEVINSFVVGAITGGILEAPSNVSHLKYAYNNSAKNSIQNNNTALAPLPINNNTINNDLNVQTNNNFQYKISDNSKINNLNQSMSQYFDNSQKTADLSNTISKVIEDKNYNVIFDNSIKNSNSQLVDAQIKTLENGEIEIRINPNSQRAGEFLLMHEVTHAIETNSMKQLIIDYASKNSEFNQALESLKQTYGTEDISSEVIADISGQLFGNQEFINNLSIEKPTVFRRIYNKIIELANKITGNSKESLFIKDLKNKWEEAYRNTTNEQAISNLNDSTKYMMTSVKGMQNGINTNNRYQDIKNRYDRALQLETSGLYDNETIRQETGWFKDKNGNWEFEISDQYTKFKIQPKANTKYKLSDIFEANTLYEMYPELKDITISFKDMKSNGNYFSVTNEISINNKLINNLDSMSGTLLHEIQHYIQNAEGLPKGTTIFLGNEQYANSKGEIEATDTKNRRNLTVEQRKNIIPESAKDNPLHPNREALLNRKRTNVEKIAEKLYNLLGDKSNELFEENDIETSKMDVSKNSKEDSDRLGIGREHDVKKELDNDSSFSLKQKQLEIIKNNNPAEDTYHTWVRSIDDIKTFEETLNDTDYKEYFEAGEDFDETYSAEKAKKALETGKITVYSSYPIEQGVFVSPSKMEAESYSGNGKVYSKEVNINDVAWIDPTQGQYAKIDTKYSQQNDIWQEHLEKNYKATGTRTYFKDMMPYATKESIKTENIQNKKTEKLLNPNEISKLKPSDANTAPILPKAKVETGKGESKFFDNILNKTDMLTLENKKSILSDNDFKYYKEVTNKESLDKAFERLNQGGANETYNWLSKPSENATSVDIAEGYILLKQYQDIIGKTTDLSTKDNLNRTMVQVAKKMRDMGTKAGQTVQAFNIMNRLTPEGMVYYAQTELTEAYNNMVKNKSKAWIDKYKVAFDLSPNETQFIMDTMQKVSKMQDGYDKKVELAKIQTLMTDKLPPERGAGIKSWMRISMLFNPKTQVRNVMGNTVIAPVNSASDLIASGIDKLISKKTNVRTTGNTNIKAYAKGFKQGLYTSYNDFKLDINTRNIEGNRFEIGQGKSFNNKTKIGKSLNTVDNLLSFMLDAGDRGFYEASFNNSINNQMILNNTTEINQDMIDIATSEALSRTWQDNNNYTKFVLDIRNGLNRVNVRGYGLGDVLIPFAKTPANLTKAIIDYSPVGMVNAVTSGINLKKSLSNGQFNPQIQHKFVQNLGKATAGTMLYVLGYALAKSGVISGESDDDKDVSNFMKNTLGINSYSIKIGDKSFTYDWAQPIAAPLSIMANFNQKQKDNPDARTLENLINSLDVAGNVLLEQSFMESINTVFSNTDGPATGIQEAILELPSRATPTFMKQIVDLTDGTQRQSYVYDQPLETVVNKVKAKVPGLSQTLVPSVDTLGREIKRYGGKNNIFNVFLNPANVNTENISESAKEIYRLYKITGDATIMPRVSPYYINSNGEKVILTNEQKSEFQKISGEIIEKNVKKLLNNSQYTSLSNEDKANIVNEIVNYSYNKARYDVLNMSMSNQYNNVNDYVDNGGQVYDYYLNKKEINYSLNNPKKYNMITSFDFKYDDYSRYQNEINNIKKWYSKTSERKQAIFNYINNLQYNRYQKIILFKMLGGYGIKDYQNEIFAYINSLKLSKNEKQTLWKNLYS